MSKFTYQRPTSFEQHPKLEPRRLLPIQPPPYVLLQSIPKPQIHSPIRASSSTPLHRYGYTYTTHLIPSAYPRLTPDIPEPTIPKNEETKEERKKRVGIWTKDLLELKWKQERGEVLGEGCREVLWNCLGRYVRNGSGKSGGEKGKGVTLFCAHANGMHKETFEPMLSHLLSQVQSTSAYQIDEIWTWDAVQHGDSAQINASKLRAIFDWADNGRDILNFFINYLPDDSAPGSSNLPVHLERVSEPIWQLRTKQGFADRKVICVGHSFGGASLVLGAYNYPAVFSGLVLVDPVIFPRDFDRSEDLRVYLNGALGRRQEWASREEARRLLNSPFFTRWDPAVLDAYVEHGMYSTSNGSVRLKTTGVQEAVVFAESLVTHEAWAVLDKLDEKIALKWIMPGEGGIGTEQLAQERVWLRPRNASNVRIAGAGHLAVQEKPREVAKEIHAFLEGCRSGTAQPGVSAGRTKAYL